ncbi:MAG: class I SAM-dependent methyltransferase [Methylotenera sp.]|nr:class I SAM-dependent methyltransferase [Oligoflexia bacterium]
MKNILDALASGRTVSDREFDLFYPNDYQGLSEYHFTPVEVAKRAAELLTVNSETRILDVGSGLGKFCFVGALTSQAHFTGVEQRAHLVRISKQIALQYRVPRVEYVEGDVRALDWTQFQSFYLFNPFIENLYPSEQKIDETVESTEQRYKELIRWVQKRLHLMPVGTRVATFHGFGGDMPPGYVLHVKEEFGSDFLRLWIKDAEVQ